MPKIVLLYGMLSISLLLGAQQLIQAREIVLKVPGGKLRGRVKRITDKAVILELKSGSEQPIPLQFLTKEQIDKCRAGMISKTDAEGLFKLAKKFFLTGNKKQAYELFQRIGKLDPSYKTKIVALITGKFGKSQNSKRKPNQPASLQDFDETHTEMFYRYGLAVVGLMCKGGKGGFYGTGAVISPTGLILTSSTVIPEDAVEIKVYFSDGHVREATLKKFDAGSESALIQITEKVSDLTFMKLANSENYKPGEPAYSWGNPHNSIMRDGTVSLSLGQLSGQYLVSSVDDQSRYQGPVIETDAAVNPGSDGGPLTDADGNLLGIMSLAFSPSRWLGLVIPMKRIIEGNPELKKLGFGKKPQWRGTKGLVWARQIAFQHSAKRAQDATVGLVVVRQGIKLVPPKIRQDEKLKEARPYPRNRMRAMFERRPPPNGACSGFLIGADGTILTSAFNLAPFKSRDPKNRRKIITRKVTKIYVYLADGKRRQAKLLGKNDVYDLAVLKIIGTKKDYPFINLSGKPTLSTGSSVAILGRSEAPGNNTLNIGSVSAMKRVSGLFVQISALMNYGNLGGPVIDLDGTVVGMAARLNSSTSWRQNCGVGFCLLSEKIKTVVADLKAGKKIKTPERPYTGLALDFSAEPKIGVVLKTVTDDSPGAKAGLKAGDVLTHINGKVIDDEMMVLNAFAQSKVGQTIKLSVLQDKNKINVQILVGKKG